MFIDNDSQAHDIAIGTDDNLLIDSNLFGQKKFSDYIALTNTYDEHLYSKLNFYYLTEEINSRGYETYHSGGYLGFTPSSGSSEMGIFHMFQHLHQADNATNL